jgi:hypothetical protein
MRQSEPANQRMSDRGKIQHPSFAVSPLRSFSSVSSKRPDLSNISDFSLLLFHSSSRSWRSSREVPLTVSRFVETRPMRAIRVSSPYYFRPGFSQFLASPKKNPSGQVILTIPLRSRVPPKSEKSGGLHPKTRCVCRHNDFSQFSSASPSTAATPNDSLQNPVNIFIHMLGSTRISQIHTDRCDWDSLPFRQGLQFSAYFPRFSASRKKIPSNLRHEFSRIHTNGFQTPIIVRANWCNSFPRSFAMSPRRSFTSSPRPLRLCGEYAVFMEISEIRV